MKKLTIVTIFCFTVSILNGCRKAADNTGNSTANATVTNTAVKPPVNTNPTAANTGADSPAKKEMPTVDLTGIDAGKPLSADELKEKFTAGPDQWKDKKVAVTGFYKSYASSPGVNAASAYRTDLRDKDTKTAVGCFSRDRPAIWDDFSKNYQKYEKEKIVVRGVVAGTVDYGDGVFVGLEPCEIVTK